MFKNLLAKMAGKWVAKKVDLQEGTMETKAWYKSKGIWTGVVAGLIGGYNGMAPSMKWPPIPDFVFVLLGAMGVYARATAESILGAKDSPPRP